MSPGVLKGIGLGCFGLCALLSLLGWHFYAEQRRQIDAVKGLVGMPGMSLMPGGGMMKQLVNMDPGWPLATNVSLVFAVFAAIGGAVCLFAGMKKATHPATAPPAAPSNLTDELARLHDLHRSGGLTSEEFAAAKAAAMAKHM